MPAVVEPVLTVQDLDVTFRNGNGGLQALKGVEFSVCPQDFVCVLGPSGCGKTTLLRVLAGLLKPTHGEVHFAGSDAPRIGLVFQQANLMPWRTALQNITLPLELKDMPLEEAQSRARELIERIGLSGFENAWPRDLSGGMAQRVALARALVQDPELLLLDEPFGALDALTRERMGDQLLDLWQAERKTVVMVTHSISEALLLSDRVLVFSPRPGTVTLEMTVDLPRPRGEGIRYTPHFGELSRSLRAAIAQE
jgi:NitT/TauT family transport system ATP-binding protein